MSWTIVRICFVLMALGMWLLMDLMRGELSSRLSQGLLPSAAFFRLSFMYPTLDKVEKAEYSQTRKFDFGGNPDQLLPGVACLNVVESLILNMLAFEDVNTNGSIQNIIEKFWKGKLQFSCWFFWHLE